GMDLAPHSPPTLDLPTRLHPRDWVARGRNHVHQPLPASVPALGLAPLGRGSRGRVPRVGREEIRGSAVGPVALETASPIAPPVCRRGFRFPDGLVPRLRRRTVLRSPPYRHDPRGS